MTDERMYTVPEVARFREENAGMERWLPVRFPAEPDKAIVYPDPFDCARFGMDFEHSTVEIIDAVESTT